MTGIEPASSVWKTEALPLSYTRVTLLDETSFYGVEWSGSRPLVKNVRDVAQLGSASVLGTEGRRFKSCHPDKLL